MLEPCHLILQELTGHRSRSLGVQGCHPGVDPATAEVLMPWELANTTLRLWSPFIYLQRTISNVFLIFRPVIAVPLNVYIFAKTQVESWVAVVTLASSGRRGKSRVWSSCYLTSKRQDEGAMTLSAVKWCVKAPNWAPCEARFLQVLRKVLLLSDLLYWKQWFPSTSLVFSPKH